MVMSFKKATKTTARLRLALIGPSGSGKTYSALSIAAKLVPGGRIAVIDTEHGSASKYADVFDFDALELDSFSPTTYVEAIKTAEKAGYDVVIIDSLSHAWSGKDGALEQKDNASKRNNGNSWTAWRDITPQHNSMVDSIVGCRSHVIATLRSKTEYVQEKDDRGRSVVRKVGLAPIQRDGIEFEFDVCGTMTSENDLIIDKTRCSALSGKVIPKPGEAFADVLRAWLSDGVPAVERGPSPEASSIHTPPSAPPRLDPAGEGPCPQDVLDDIDSFSGKLTVAAAASIFCDHAAKIKDAAPSAGRALANAAGCNAATLKRAIAFERWSRAISAAKSPGEVDAARLLAAAEVAGDERLWGKVEGPAALSKLGVVCAMAVAKLSPPEPPSGGGSPRPTPTEDTEAAAERVATTGESTGAVATTEHARFLAGLAGKMDAKEHAVNWIADKEETFELPTDEITRLAIEQLCPRFYASPNLVTNALRIARNKKTSRAA